MNEDIRNHEIMDNELEQVSGGNFTVVPLSMSPKLPLFISPNGEQKSKELSDDALESVAGGYNLTQMPVFLNLFE